MSDGLAPRTPTTDPVVASVAALALPTDDADQRWTLRTSTVAWLKKFKSDHTRRAYFRDLGGWLTWCEATGLDPRAARRGDVDAYLADTAQGLSAATTARRLSAVSSWYAYLVSNEVTPGNPAAAVDRPHIDRDASSTVGLTATETKAFIRAARQMPGRARTRNVALLGMLAELGLRVGEALALDVASLGHNRGHRTVRVIGKGNRRRELPIPAALGRVIDAYLTERARAAGTSVGKLTGPLFVTAGGKRMLQPHVFGLVRRVARAAGLPAAERLSPHGLRHSAATTALDAKAELRDVQDMLGHADPRTTRRYDRSRGSLDRSPAYLLASVLADDETELTTREDR